MLENAFPRQHEILGLFMEHKEGLSIDALSQTLNISRTATQRHLSVLEGNGFIQKSQSSKTAGRPMAIYEITGLGINYFPKQYAWFSELILNDLLEEMGSDQFVRYMRRLGKKVADSLEKRMAGIDEEQQLNELVKIMNELGYKAKAQTDCQDGLKRLYADNCVYHDLAQKHQQICKFDVSIMSSLLNKTVQLTDCMARGDCQCRFVIHEE
jgi:DeoR family transcriptional regulator, suf operon transcriptional repressor